MFLDARVHALYSVCCPICTHFADNRKKKVKKKKSIFRTTDSQHTKGKLDIILEVKSNQLDVTEGSSCSHAY